MYLQYQVINLDSLYQPELGEHLRNQIVSFTQFGDWIALTDLGMHKEYIGVVISIGIF
jgi:hypothetical protein